MACRLRNRPILLRALALLFACMLFYSIATLLQYENVFSRGYDYDELPESPLFSVNFYRQFFDYLETPLVICKDLARFGKILTWYEPVLCLSAPSDIQQTDLCLVYAFHHTSTRTNYMTFEKSVAGMGCEVHVFDLTDSLTPSLTGEVGGGSITWHVVGGKNDREHFTTLEDIVDRLGHVGRNIHHLRIAIDFDTSGRERLHPFLRELQQLRHGEVEFLGRQVEQLQLTVALRPASLRSVTLASYQRAWWLFSDLHKRGFSVLDSRSSGRVVWLPGLGRQVATQYNVLFGRHMPQHMRRSAALAALRAANTSATPRQERETAQLIVR